MRRSSWKVLLLALFLFALPTLAQDEQEAEAPPEVMQGYVYQNALTQESYLITNAEELKAFVLYLPPVTPYKKLPAPPNPDPFLKGFTVDFEQNVIAVTVGRNRIVGFPEYRGVEELTNGDRQVHFTIPAPSAEAYPYGWALYSAVVLPKTVGKTSVVVESLKRTPSW